MHSPKKHRGPDPAAMYRDIHPPSRLFLRLDLSSEEHDRHRFARITESAKRHPIKSNHSRTLAVEIGVLTQGWFTNLNVDPITRSPPRRIREVVQVRHICRPESDFFFHLSADGMIKVLARLDPASRQGPILLAQVASLLVGTALSHHQDSVVPDDHCGYSKANRIHVPFCP